MTVDVVKLAGDYYIQTASQGNITLDTGANTGTVTITGNLIVQGTSTTIVSETVTIKDQIITVNEGETANGGITNNITNFGNVGGLLVDRGNAGTWTLAATLFYNDVAPWTTLNGTQTKPGLWQFRVGDGLPQSSVISVAGIRLDTTGWSADDITINGLPRLSILGKDNYDALISVKSLTSGTYLNNLLTAGDPDDIPNVAYVNYVFTNTQVTTAEKAHQLVNISPSGDFLSFINIVDEGQQNQGQISMFVDGYLTVNIDSDSVQLANISISGNSIQPFSTGTNLNLVTNYGAEVVVNSALTYQVPDAPPTASANQTKVYATTSTGIGGTALLYTNETTTDELVGARRMLIYSMIF